MPPLTPDEHAALIVKYIRECQAYQNDPSQSHECRAGAMQGEMDWWAALQSYPEQFERELKRMSEPRLEMSL